MSDIFDNFVIFNEIDVELKQRIKIFYIFDDEKGYNVLFITEEDNVFGFGSNQFGCCDLGHNSVVNEPQIIPELCHKSIQQFFNGRSFVLALSSGHQLYQWGCFGVLGQLEREGYISEIECLRPRQVILENESFAQISCGSDHILGLTLNGNVYGWGDNEWGQIGCPEERGQLITNPIQLICFEKNSIKSVHSSFRQSYALTVNGMVYCWGYNDCCHSGHDFKKDLKVFKPKLINISNVISVCPSSVNTYFLTNEGHIYFCLHFDDQNNCHSFQESPKTLNNEMIFSSLLSIPYYQKSTSIVSTVYNNTVYSLNENKFFKTDYKTLFEFYAKEYKITFKTIDIRNSFEIISELGSGGFGTVYKVINRLDKREFALKKISFEKLFMNEEEVLREVKNWSKYSTDYVIKYFNSWNENNCLYIQMELCFNSLKNIFQQKYEVFRRKSEEEMNCVEYFISCELFKELLECVQYLHESNPPIIHKDLKPQNILIIENSRNDRFLKLCDFGLSKLDELNPFAHDLDNFSDIYMAPEVKKCRKYNIRSNIYSLGVIGKELFDFAIIDSDEVINNDILKKYLNILKTMVSMKHLNSRERPTCAQILNTSYEWSITKSQFKTFGIEKSVIVSNNRNQFFVNFFNEKRLSLKSYKEKGFLSLFK